MKQELMDAEVVAMYDIRDIQGFIFKTNKVKDIEGASIMVEELLYKGLKDTWKEVSGENSSEGDPTQSKTYYLDWKPEDTQGKDRERLRIESEENIWAQVLFIGGGNAYVIYRSGKKAREANRKLANWILENTYSLQLVSAVVRKTSDFHYDYENLQKEMSQVKRRMNRTSYLGALPIVDREKDTGFPISESIGGKGAQGAGAFELVSKEVSLKRKALRENSSKDKRRTILDDLVDGKGEDSTLAIVHIDGNSMGSRITELIRKGGSAYPEAVDKMRTISGNIEDSFQSAYEEMETKAATWAACGQKENLPIQKIILAGDDLTFVCTGKLALSLVEVFADSLAEYRLYKDKDQEYGLSICAGIAYFYSHFPFSDAYQMAEKCCQSAKEYAKKEEHRNGDVTGNWVDFEFCSSLLCQKLKDFREKNYQVRGGKRLQRRPYYLPFPSKAQEEYLCLNEKEGNQKASIEGLKENRKRLGGQVWPDKNEEKEKLARSDIAAIRNTYFLGEDAMEELFGFLRSRKKLEDWEKTFDEAGRAVWYDAAELFDLYEDVEEAK